MSEPLQLYFLVSAATWVWVSAALCLELNCYIALSLQIYGPGLSWYILGLTCCIIGIGKNMGLGLCCFISGSLQLYRSGSQLLYVLVSITI